MIIIEKFLEYLKRSKPLLENYAGMMKNLVS
jgi:hypothetical protein